MRVLVCPDKFRGTATAPQVATALETGWRRARPNDTVDLLPLADGGEGTLEALAADASLRSATVAGPLGDPVEVAFALRADGTAVLESARAIGLDLLSPSRRDPRRTTTRGLGELIGAAMDAGARRILVGLGGSATNDGGAGLAQALGARLVDASGRPVGPGGSALLELAGIDLRGLDPRLASVEVVGLTDVDNPLTGPRGASAIFGPQKGARSEDVWTLDHALGHLAAVVRRDLGLDAAGEPGAGAAGGLGYGLCVFAGARLRSGAASVGEVVGLQERVGAADLVVTGEGALDATSLGTKVVGQVLRLAGLCGCRVAVVCGRAEVRPPGVEVVALVEEVGEAAALRDVRVALVEVGERLAARSTAREGVG
ncbi:MAG: glycerate kinase [Planctomycetaceae bacterium]